MQIVTVLGESQDLWQWDLGRKVSVNDETCTSVHFGDVLNDKSYQVSVREENGERVAYVPNIVLQNSGVLPVYAYLETEDCGYTIRSCSLDVKRKEKPSDYVYEKEDLTVLENLSNRISELESEFDEEIKVFPINVTEKISIETSEISCDKTFDEIKNAISKKYFVYCAYNNWLASYNEYYYLSSNTSVMIDFVRISGESSKKISISKLGVRIHDINIVKTVNGISPDESGNVNVSGGGDGAGGAVLSVNGKVGVVQLTAADVGALPNTTEIPSVPSALPNPNALTFTGAVSATYDGSKPVEVVIPQGGGGGTKLETIIDETLTEAVVSIDYDFGKAYKYLDVYIYTSKAEGNTTNNNNIRFLPNRYNGYAVNAGCISIYGSFVFHTILRCYKEAIVYEGAYDTGRIQGGSKVATYFADGIQTVNLIPNTSGETDTIPAGTHIIIRGREEL